MREVVGTAFIGAACTKAMPQFLLYYELSIILSACC